MLGFIKNKNDLWCSLELKNEVKNINAVEGKENIAKR